MQSDIYHPAVLFSFLQMAWARSCNMVLAVAVSATSGSTSHPLNDCISHGTIFSKLRLEVDVLPIDRLAGRGMNIIAALIVFGPSPSSSA